MERGRTSIPPLGNLALWPALPNHHITLESFHRIKPGITRKKVLEILGVPPGNYFGGGWAEYFGHGTEQCSTGEEGVGDELAIRVEFNAEGIVQLCFMGEVRRQEDLLFKLRTWLGLARPPLRVHD